MANVKSIRRSRSKTATLEKSRPNKVRRVDKEVPEPTTPDVTTAAFEESRPAQVQQLNDTAELKRCPGCNVLPGELHESGCEVEPCPYCGRQLLSCDHFHYDVVADDRVPWRGEWPRVRDEAVWSRDQKTWTLPDA